MKKTLFTLTGLFVAGLIYSQTASTAMSSVAGIKLAKGQKITVESSTSIEASLTMGMEFNSNSTSENTLEVKNSDGKTSTVGNTLVKLKVDINGMGESMKYDSEDKENNNADIAKVFEDRMNKTTEVNIDNSTGTAVTIGPEKPKKKNEEDANPMEGMMKMFANNSDDAVVSGAFEIIPQGKKTGDSWADTVKMKDMKMTRIYTLKSVSENEAIIELNIVSSALNKMEFQGMPFEITTNTKTVGAIYVDPNNGLVKKRTSTSDITGNIPFMGQDMPISAKTTSTSTYK